MHQPQLNPATSLRLNGKTRRYANGTVATRHLRLDREADANLAYLQHALTGDSSGDFVSISLVCRRALDVFRSHVAALNRDALQQEQRRVRDRSQMPRLKKKKPEKEDLPCQSRSQ